MSAQLIADNWQVLIFDTGPLRELIVYAAVHQLGFHSLNGDLRHLREPGQYSRLTEFVRLFPQRTTSPHVVTEIGAWIARTSKPGQTAMWRIVRDEFISMGMDETALKFLDMRFDLVTGKGIADASVVHLGLKLAERKPRVLTVDSGLVSECKKSGISAVHLYEVIA